MELDHCLSGAIEDGVIAYDISWKQYHCRVCKVSLCGGVDADNHMKSSKHREAGARYAVTYPREAPQSLLDIISPVGVEAAKKGDISLDKTMAFMCHICSVPLSGAIPLRCHLASEIHKKKATIRRAVIWPKSGAMVKMKQTPPVYQSSRDPVEDVTHMKGMSDKEPSHISCTLTISENRTTDSLCWKSATNFQPTAELTVDSGREGGVRKSPVTAPSFENRYLRWAVEDGVVMFDTTWKQHVCRVCKIPLSGCADLQKHLEGSKHREAGARYAVANPHKAPQSLLDLLTPLGVEAAKNGDIILNNTLAFICKICKMPMSGVVPLKCHLDSEVHRKNIKGQRNVSFLPSGFCTSFATPCVEPKGIDFSRTDAGFQINAGRTVEYSSSNGTEMASLFTNSIMKSKTTTGNSRTYGLESDIFQNFESGNPKLCTEQLKSTSGETTPMETDGINMPTTNLSPSQTSKNPIMILNELRQGTKYKLKDEWGEPHAKTFTYQVYVDGHVFEGSGNSKKSAKAAAAQRAVSKLCGIKVSPNFPQSMLPPSTCSRLSLADEIVKVVCDKFMELTHGNSTLSKRKVLAGIVMTNDTDPKDIQVVSIATGTKCINGERLSLKGNTINDCHAEIVARRCLMHFLFTHLEDIAKSRVNTMPKNNIFELTETRSYRVKSHYKFHLYINTSPCGDARIFSPHEAADHTDPHPNRQNRGLLRTKIESGEGTIPIKADADSIQTWDAVLQGERLRTMSCSDKIARWNVVGLQGALASVFIDPVYLESIVIGSLFSVSHMYRAVCGRIERTVQRLPLPFRLNQPKLSCGSYTESRLPQKSPTISVSWDCRQNQLEVVNAMTGRLENGENSKLCKRRFFQRFVNLVKHLHTTTEVDPKVADRLSYREAKALSTKYQLSKRIMIKGFSDAGLGKWIGKPMEEEDFYL